MEVGVVVCEPLGELVERRPLSLAQPLDAGERLGAALQGDLLRPVEDAHARENGSTWVSQSVRAEGLRVCDMTSPGPVNSKTQPSPLFSDWIVLPCAALAAG